MRAGPDNEPLASPGDFFPDRQRRMAEPFAELLGRSFLALPHFAAVDNYIMRVAFSLDLDLAKFHQSYFHISISARSTFEARDPDSKNRLKRKSPFKFHKRPQLFIDTHNKASSVSAVCGGNPKLSALVVRN